MKQVFVIFFFLSLSSYLFSQTLEDRAASRTIEYLRKVKDSNDANYRDCISRAIADCLAQDGKPDDRTQIGTVTGIKSLILKVDSIVKESYVPFNPKDLAKKRAKYYAIPKDGQLSWSMVIGGDMMSDKKFDFAIESYGMALMTDSTFVPALDNTAVCYKKKGDLQNAIKFYEKSLNVFPEGDYALMNIGVIFTELSNFKLSNKYYKRLVAFYPNNAEGYFGLGKNYLLLGELEKSLENMCISHSIYSKENNTYISDTEKIISMICKEMGKVNKMDDFDRIVKKYKLKNNYH